MAPSTAKRTLYRLTGVTPTPEGMLDVLDDEQLDRCNADIHFPDREVLPVPSLLIVTSADKEEAPWSKEVARTTGRVISEPVRRMGALHMFAVDGDVYAVGYDQGYRLLPDRFKDTRFGLGFAIRRVNPMQVRDLQAHTLGEARTDIAIVPGGTPAPALGVQEHAQVVRRLGGYLDGIELTRVRGDGNQDTLVSVEGGCGLRLPLGIEPADLIRDVREVARVVREESPRRDLAFVEHMMPVKDGPTLARLEQLLDDVLGESPDERTAMVVPRDAYRAYTASQVCHIKISSSEPGRNDRFDFDYLLNRVRVQRDGQRLAALKQGSVSLYRDRRARHADLICSTKALHWIEAYLSIGTQRFCLLEGEWYEIGATFLETTRKTIARLFAEEPSVDMPPWRSGDEKSYNEHVRDVRSGYVCLDRKNVGNPLERTNKIEICDLLTPDDTLVMVKHAHGGSGPLSHLFTQGRVAVELLRSSPEVRGEFAQNVLRESHGKRTLPEDFVPKHVVFAVLLKRGTRLTPETLFPFSQIALAHAARALETMNVTVEVVGIDEGEVDARSMFRQAA